MRRAALLIALSFAGCGDDETVPDPPPRLYTPRWAFLPWISKDISDGPDTYAFVQGFADRDIPFGVVVLDSPWDTNYTEFDPNPDRYPDFAAMVAELRGRGIRTVLWCTQMTNEQSFDLEEGGDRYERPALTFVQAKREGYLVNGGETYFWWKGMGGGVDFFNPAAVAWWRALQDPLLDMGIAGWKLDFGESYLPLEGLDTAKGRVTHQEYSEAYYRDFWEHGLTRRGEEEFVTMVRAYDESYQFAGRFFARKEHAPVVWAGDNRRDFVGLVDALDHVFRSAAAGYVVVGSDLGGYLDRDDHNFTDLVPEDVEVFQRWTAVSALMPFMQLHGRANLTPWTVKERVDETVANYRYWSWLHTALVPYFYSESQEAYAERAPPILRPIGGGPSDWANDWRYTLGDDLLVAPLLDHTGARDVLLPPGRWLDWWALDAPARAGGAVVEGATPGVGRVPVYVAEGAVVAAEVTHDQVPQLGGPEQAGALTLIVFPGLTPGSARIHEGDGVVVEVATRRDPETRIELTAHPRPIWLAILDAADAEVLVDGAVVPRVAARAALADAGEAVAYVAAARTLWVKLEARSQPRLVTVR